MSVLLDPLTKLPQHQQRTVVTEDPLLVPTSYKALPEGVGVTVTGILPAHRRELPQLPDTYSCVLRCLLKSLPRWKTVPLKMITAVVCQKQPRFPHLGSRRSLCSAERGGLAENWEHWAPRWGQRHPESVHPAPSVPGRSLETQSNPI